MAQTISSASLQSLFRFCRTASRASRASEKVYHIASRSRGTHAKDLLSVSAALVDHRHMILALAIGNDREAAQYAISRDQSLKGLWS